ncbi:uncharacterized protein KGF55_003487 [Candida pseudojiufengensis]|uniref:uncharacterized protein n=1 Tax=Candida pseudojiufengensis TaxID=497109 RepID=UPI002224C00D|nr:uncharacterized protein KGF55_003487 [Candida pseudojiufengensis]KAI5962411.1 hypothetical protein KGF55_003487 [Candida pseudojiufengensis]
MLKIIKRMSQTSSTSKTPSKLLNLAINQNSSSFTSNITPDKRIPNIEIAKKNDKNITNTPRNLINGGFSWVLPTKRNDYEFLIANPKALKDLNLTLEEIEEPIFQQIVSGEFYNDSENIEKYNLPFPYAQAYAGWQFGQFAGQLGDGRVINLFELPKPPTTKEKDLENRPIYELQLKGAGKTPFSRFADGKAVLRSSIREYIISEHLNALGIPTTRALSLTSLPSTLAQRHSAERCAIVARFAESWIRLGTFDLYRYRGDREGIRQLSDYVINNLFTINDKKFQNFERIKALKPSLIKFKNENIVEELTNYDKMYYESIIRNAETTAICQCYGFLNGVLNTDNTSILGLTVDFGPFSIMDKYDPNYTPNSEDHQSRYGYRNVPTAIWWNLTRLGEDLAELIGAGPKLLKNPEFDKGVKEEWEEDIIKRATIIIETGGEIYQYSYTLKYIETFFKRLGLSLELIDKQNPDIQNTQLITPMLDILYKLQTDFNLFFLDLQNINFNNQSYEEIAESFLKDYNPDKNRNSKEEISKEFKVWLKIYHNYIKDSSNKNPPIASNYNPKFLPRNWILNQVIEQAQDSRCSNISYLKKLQKMSSNPFTPEEWGNELKELEKSWLLQGEKGDDYSMLQCSCSS